MKKDTFLEYLTDHKYNKMYEGGECNRLPAGCSGFIGTHIYNSFYIIIKKK